LARRQIDEGVTALAVGDGGADDLGIVVGEGDLGVETLAPAGSMIVPLTSPVDGWP
jgi:hypothetical protein